MDELSPYASPAPPPPPVEVIPAETVVPRPWGFWATSGWGLLAAVVWLFTNVAIGVVIGLVMAALNPNQDVTKLLEGLDRNGLLIAVVTIICGPVTLTVCILAALVRRWRVTEYLGLKSFSTRDLLLGVGCLAVLIPISDGLMYLTDRPIVPEFMEAAWRTAGFLPLLIVALVVAAPLFEELFFRGFLFRGWAASAMGPVGATLLTSALWSVIHLQYDWFQILHIFVGGLFLGWLRWRSGSTTLTILLHGLMNLVATIEAAIKFEILS